MWLGIVEPANILTICGHSSRPSGLRIAYWKNIVFEQLVGMVFFRRSRAVPYCQLYTAGFQIN